MNAADILVSLEIEPVNCGAWGSIPIDRSTGPELPSINPATGAPIASVRMAGVEDYGRIAAGAQEVFSRWRMVPAQRRGRIVREIGDELRAHKDELGALVTLETGKILAEGLGEVQEAIDLADFAAGLSRQLSGVTLPSERSGHRMFEQWRPLGVVGVITPFNFPLGAWSRDALLAAVCGDCVIWKPSRETPLSAIAVHRICRRVLESHGWPGVFNLCVGTGEEIGEAIAADARLPLVSFTGSPATGQQVAIQVAGRLGRTILELGGNSGMIVMDDANLDLALAAILAGAFAAAGQSCTTTRRLFLQCGIASKLREALAAAYRQVRIGDPLDPETGMGPLIHERAVQNMTRGLRAAKEQGCELICGGRRLSGCFVEPALVRAHPGMPILQEEILAPVLYLMEFERLDEAIAWHNAAPRGHSSAIFTSSLAAAETFLSLCGSESRMVNVNLGTSDAEVGGAFGRENDRGAGSYAWKAYMRRQTSTINGISEPPPAKARVRT